MEIEPYSGLTALTKRATTPLAILHDWFRCYSDLLVTDSDLSQASVVSFRLLIDWDRPTHGQSNLRLVNEIAFIHCMRIELVLRPLTEERPITRRHVCFLSSLSTLSSFFFFNFTLLPCGPPRVHPHLKIVPCELQSMFHVKELHSRPYKAGPT